MFKHNLKYSLMLIIACSSMMYAQQECPDVGAVVTNSPAYTIDAQFRALFLKPGADNLYYAAEAFPFNDSIAVPAASPHWQIYDLHPDYRFAFDIGLACVFHERNSTLFANWEHFNSHTCVTTPVVSTEQYPNPMIGPFSSIGPDAAHYDSSAGGQVKFRFNELNVRYGQYLQVGDYLETNLFTGITFADIKQYMQSIYIGTGYIGQIITVPSSFIGAGPQFGIDFAYNVVCGVHFNGQFFAALLMGRGKNHTCYDSFSPLLQTLGNPSPNTQSTSVQNKMRMVPELTERLAVAYFLCFCDHYRAKLEVGFEAKMFFNAFQLTNLASGVIDVAPYDNTVGVFARTFERTVSSFSLSGPYIAFNMAY